MPFDDPSRFFFPKWPRENPASQGLVIVTCVHHVASPWKAKMEPQKLTVFYQFLPFVTFWSSPNGAHPKPLKRSLKTPQRRSRTEEPGIDVMFSFSISMPFPVSSCWFSGFEDIPRNLLVETFRSTSVSREFPHSGITPGGRSRAKQKTQPFPLSFREEWYVRIIRRMFSFLRFMRQVSWSGCGLWPKSAFFSG